MWTSAEIKKRSAFERSYACLKPVKLLRILLLINVNNSFTLAALNFVLNANHKIFEIRALFDIVGNARTRVNDG